MTTEQIESVRTQTRQFGDHYDYDTSYMLEMLEASPAAFELFRAVPAMAGFREALPRVVGVVAGIAALTVADCGPCLELSIKMAREAGVPAEVLRAALREPAALPAELAEVHRYATDVANGLPPEETRVAAMRERYGPAGLVELSLNIAAVLVFPAVKRALGHARSCALTTFSV